MRDWLVDNLQPKEDNLGWKITQARNHAQTIRTWTTNVGNPGTLKSAAADLQQIFQEGRELIDGPSALSVSVEETGEPYSSHLFENRPVRDFIASGAEMMRDFAENELADADQFMASPSGESCGPGSVCANFRKELSMLFTSAEEVINGVAGLGGVAPQSADAHLQGLETDIQLDLVISLLQRLPDRVLYVLYRVNESIGFTQRAKRLQEAAEGLELLAPLFSQTSSSAMKGVGTSAVDTCSLVQGQEQLYAGLATGLIGVGLLSRAPGGLDGTL